MSPDEPPAAGTARERELRQELQAAYEALTDITSRLLLASEAAEAALSGDDSETISHRFLRTVARGIEARRAALFLADRDGIRLGAAFGLDHEGRDALADSAAELAACEAARESRRVHVVDAELLAADARAALEAAGADEGEAEAGPDEAAAEAADEGGADEAGDPEGGLEQEPLEEEGADEEEDGPASFGLYLPVHLEDQAVAVLGLGDRAGGRLYRNEDLVFLTYLLRQFALTLHRSTLLEQHQRGLEERDALLKVSREITSVLDLDAVLGSVVNTVAAVVPNDRAEIVLARGGRLSLRAVSGMTRLDPDQTELFKLTTVLEYLRTHPERIHIGAADLGDEPPPAGRDVFAEYFSSQQMRSFMALPLKDDQGLLGFLCLESVQEAWEIPPTEGDALSILAGQTTVAIRNATLYSEIPLRGFARPVSRLRGRVAGLSPRRRTAGLALAAAVLLALLLPITPERVGGGAEVRPLHLQGVRALTAGVVTRAHVSGGEEVRAGQPLAEIEDLELAGRLADLRAQIEGARRDVAAARRAGDVAAWRSGELRLAGLQGTLAVEERRASARVLTAPLAGQVLELDLGQRVGQHVAAGQSFCTVAALQVMAVDFEVPEERIGRVQVGQPVVLRAMSFPTRVFRGRVSEVGWRAHTDGGGRARFTVRAEVANPDRRLRPGMTGVAKASVGHRPAAALLLDPALRAVQMSLW